MNLFGEQEQQEVWEDPAKVFSCGPLVDRLKLTLGDVVVFRGDAQSDKFVVRMLQYIASHTSQKADKTCNESVKCLSNWPDADGGFFLFLHNGSQICRLMAKYSKKEFADGYDAIKRMSEFAKSNNGIFLVHWLKDWYFPPIPSIRCIDVAMRHGDDGEFWDMGSAEKPFIWESFNDLCACSECCSKRKGYGVFI